MAPDHALLAEMPVDQAFDIVLQPVSHPELGAIRIDENLFAIGRTEPPFDSYAPEIVADLSRRHARIFSEYGAVYIADLDSKNGTAVNGINVQQKITRLHDGDDICFAGRLSYRVQLGTRADLPSVGRGARLASVTLEPENSDLGLQPIVITRFPFLISKVDEAFSRYKDGYPHQVNYLSRRHAHIFVKGGLPFVEDLGSTNGSFVAGKRLDEHAVALHDGDVVAFGGHHFVYKVSIQTEEFAVDPTVTKLSAAVRSAAPATGDADKTTFVAAAGSFLDIFCVDQAPQQEDEVNVEAVKQPADVDKAVGRHRSRGKARIFLSELADAFGGGEPKTGRRGLRWGILLLALLAIAAFLLYFKGTPEGDVKDLLAAGEYARAATVASRGLARHPDNPQLRALGSEALLKADVPKWLALLKAGQFGRAAAMLADMKRLGHDNADVLPLLAELGWIADLEKLVASRGGADQPIRDDADEGRIKRLLKQWNDDVQEHQRKFNTISSIVPEFRDTYANALSHMRKLALVAGQSRKGGRANAEGKSPDAVD